MEKLKRVIIKEELVELTGDYKLAIVLNQMVYWMERRKDADKFLMEEQERRSKYLIEGEASIQSKMKLSHGWIYKKAEELSEETMINVKPKAMRRYLKSLVEKGWLDERRNPDMPLDRTLQYRVNLLKIQLDLSEIRYALERYPLPKVQKENTKDLLENRKVQKENTRVQKENTRVQKENTEDLLEAENTRGLDGKKLPEITTEITTEMSDDDASHSSDNSYNLIQQMFVISGYDSIKKPAEHYHRFQQALKEIGKIEKLVELANKYIQQVKEGKHEHNTAQIVWFLSGGWKNFIRNEKPTRPKPQGTQKPMKKLPWAVQRQMDIEAGLIKEEPLTPEQLEKYEQQKARVQEKMRLMEEELNSTKGMYQEEA